MRRVARVVAAALAVAVSPHVVRAEGPPPASIQVYCQPGSLNNCFAFGFQSADGHVTYWLQNLQGTLSPETTPFDIDQILQANRAVEENGQIVQRLEYREQTPAGVPSYSNCGVFSLEGAITPGGDCFEILNQDVAGRDVYNTYLKLAGAGFLGCTPTPGLGAGGQGTRAIAQNCVRDGLNGWVRFDASAYLMGGGWSPDTLRAATFDDLYIVVTSANTNTVCEVHVGPQSGYTSSRPDCATTLAYADILNGGPTTTVPEPGTLALLGTGLAGTLGVGSRSRRKRT